MAEQWLALLKRLLPARMAPQLDGGLAGWLLRELVYALLVKKDHAAAGMIVVLMGVAATLIAKLDKDEIRDLSLAMARLGTVRAEAVEEVCREFGDALGARFTARFMLLAGDQTIGESRAQLVTRKQQ